MKYEFSYTYKDAVFVKKELENFLKKSRKDSPFYKFSRWIIAAIFWLSFVSFLMDFRETPYEHSDLVTHLCIVLVSVMMMFFLIRYREKSQLKNYYAKQKRVEMDILDASLLISRSDGIYTTVNFSALKAVFQSHNSVLIVVDELTCFYVPNHNFKSVDAKVEFVSLLHERITGASLDQ